MRIERARKYRFAPVAAEFAPEMAALERDYDVFEDDDDDAMDALVESVAAGSGGDAGMQQLTADTAETSRDAAGLEDATDCAAPPLEGVVAFLEVKLDDGLDGAPAVRKVLASLGARVTGRWSESVNVMVWKNGRPQAATRAIARGSGVAVVTPRWVEACRVAGARLPAAQFSVDLDPVAVQREIDEPRKRKRSPPTPKPARVVDPSDARFSSSQQEAARATPQKKAEAALPDAPPAEEVEKRKKPRTPTATPAKRRAALAPVTPSAANARAGKAAPPGDAQVKEPPAKRARRRTPASTPRTRTKLAVCTSAVGEATRDIVVSTARALRARVEPGTGPATHLVVESRARTLKLLFALARRAWVVSPAWVYTSLELGEWAPEAPHEQADLFPGVRDGREAREAGRPPLLDGLSVHVAPQVDEAAECPPLAELECLVADAGGTVVADGPGCDLCLVPADAVDEFVAAREARSGPAGCGSIVRPAWLFDSLQAHKVLPRAKYDLTPGLAARDGSDTGSAPPSPDF